MKITPDATKAGLDLLVFVSDCKILIVFIFTASHIC